MQLSNPPTIFKPCHPDLPVVGISPISSIIHHHSVWRRSRRNAFRSNSLIRSSSELQNGATALPSTLSNPHPNAVRRNASRSEIQFSHRAWLRETACKTTMECLKTPTLRRNIPQIAVAVDRADISSRHAGPYFSPP